MHISIKFTQICDSDREWDRGDRGNQTGNPLIELKLIFPFKTHNGIKMESMHVRTFSTRVLDRHNSWKAEQQHSNFIMTPEKCYTYSSSIIIKMKRDKLESAEEYVSRFMHVASETIPFICVKSNSVSPILYVIQSAECVMWSRKIDNLFYGEWHAELLKSIVNWIG